MKESSIFRAWLGIKHGVDVLALAAGRTRQTIAQSQHSPLAEPLMGLEGYVIISFKSEVEQPICTADIIRKRWIFSTFYTN